MIRWGILGCGDVTEVKSGPALQEAGRSSVVACMRRDFTKAKDYATRHDIDRAYSDADALINDPDVNAVYIATPPDSHAELTIRALSVGKSVLVEKPMALNTTDCEAMIEAATENAVSLTVAYYRRALPRFERLRDTVQSGKIGTPRCVSIRHFRRAKDLPRQSWKLDPKVGGGGIFADTQTHVLDWLDYVFGPATSVSGSVRKQCDDYPAEDLVSYSIGFESIIANGLCSYATDQSLETVTIHGSKASVTTSFFGPAPLILSQNGVRTVYHVLDPTHVHQPFVERVISHLLDGAENPCPPEAALRTTAVVGQIYG